MKILCVIIFSLISSRPFSYADIFSSSLLRKCPHVLQQSFQRRNYFPVKSLLSTMHNEKCEIHIISVPLYKCVFRTTIGSANNVIYSLNVGLNWINHDSQWNVNLKTCPFIKTRKQIQRINPDIKTKYFHHFTIFVRNFEFHAEGEADAKWECLRTEYWP